MLDEYKLGKRIKEARKSNGLTGEQLAEKLNLSVGFLREVERGSKKPSIDTFVMIANELNVSADELLCDSIHKSHQIVLTGIAKKLEELPQLQVSMIEKLIENVL